MAASNKNLKQSAEGIFAPQHYSSLIDDYEYAQGENGAAFVTLKTPQKEFTFANSVDVAGSSEYEDGAKRCLTVEFFGSSGADATFTAIAVRGNRTYPIQGVKVAGGELDIVGIPGENSGPIKPGMIVEFRKPAGSNFKIEWTEPTGGTVSAVATVI